MPTKVDEPQPKVDNQKPGKQDEPTSGHKPTYVLGYTSVCGSHEYSPCGSRVKDYGPNDLSFLSRRHIYLILMLVSLKFL